MKFRLVPVIALAATVLAIASASFAKSSNPKGQQVFQSKCSMCHGMDGKGYSAIHTPNFTSPKWQASITNPKIVSIITHGKPHTRMPAFGKKLTAAQINAVAAYLRSFNSAKKK